MNKEKIAGVIRHVMTFGGGYAVSKGWIDESMVPELIGAVIAVFGVIWSFAAKKEKVSE